jgi:hypothetical protein
MEKQETFTRIMLTLPEKTFFSIMRNYLGPLQTPFHKPALVKRLISFLTRRDVQAAAAALADRLDRQLLTATALMEEPGIQDLYPLFSDTLEFYQFYYTVLNLEQRLLILPSPAGNTLIINPLFSEMVWNELIDVSLLFEPRERSPQSGGENRSIPCPAAFYTDNLFIPALLCTFVHKGALEETGDAVKKMPAERLFSSSPGNNDPAAAAWHSAVNALLALGVLRLKRNCAVPSPGISLKWVEDFAAAVPYPPLLLPALAAMIKASVNRESIERISQILIWLTALHDTTFTEKDLGVLLQLTAPCGATHKPERIEAAALLAAFLELGILKPAEDETCFSVNPRSLPALRAAVGSPLEDPKRGFEGSAVVDSDFSVHIRPLSWKTKSVLSLLLPLELESVDVVYRFMLNQQSFIRACDLGATAEDVAAELELAGAKPLPQHIRHTLNSWYERYRRITLYSGIVLKTDASLARVITSHEEFAGCILETLAEGIFLLDGKSEHIWRPLLVSFGLEYLPKIRYAAAKGVEKDTAAERAEIQPDLLQQLLLPPEKGKHIAAFVEKHSAAEVSSSTDAADLHRREMHRVLSAHSLNSRSREEAAARIDKKLILAAEQLAGSARRQDSLLHAISEAGGLDYQGKINICRQAAAGEGDLLEVHEGGAEQTVTLVRPRSLEFSAREEAVLIGESLPDERMVSIPVRRIFLLRKLPAVLFNP